MNPQRITRLRRDGRVVVREGFDDFYHEALDHYGPGKTVYILRAGSHGLAVYTDRSPRGRRGQALCIASRAPGVRVGDRAQTAMHLPS